MIGKSVSNAVLDGWTGAFYSWDGEVKVRPGSAAMQAWLGDAAESALHVQRRHAVSPTAAPFAARRSSPTPQDLLDGVRASINGIAEGWTREQRDACLQETPATFAWGGKLVQLITGGKPVGPH